MSCVHSATSEERGEITESRDSFIPFSSRPLFSRSPPRSRLLSRSVSLCIGISPSHFLLPILSRAISVSLYSRWVLLSYFSSQLLRSVRCLFGSVHPPWLSLLSSSSLRSDLFSLLSLRSLSLFFASDPRWICC